MVATKAETGTGGGVGIAIRELLRAAGEAADALTQLDDGKTAKALRAAMDKVTAALKGAQPKPDPKEVARKKEADDDAELDARLAREA